MGEVMPLTPEDVSNKRFTPVRLREGYDMGEVDQFLDEVEAELARLTRENEDLRTKLSAAQQGGIIAPAPVEEKAPEPIKAFRRVFPPLRIGSVALDLSFLAVLLICYLLLYVNRMVWAA